MFNNCNSKTNGEFLFYNLIKNKITTIFDIGCRNDSEFINFNGEVHYFDPVDNFINELKNKNKNNFKSFYNTFGLSNETTELYYFPKYQSFYDRINSCKISDTSNKIILQVKTGKDYMIKHNIKNIDFIKIDTEGYEFNVIKGFEEYIENINIIQFEYGGTFLDNKVKLNDLVDYLKNFGFHKFSYLTPNGLSLITDFTDHYQYCNIVCLNKKINNYPFNI
jgi:FkbM family methyltransferase